MHHLSHPSNPLYSHNFPYNVTCKCLELLIFNINIDQVIKILESQEDTKLNNGELILKILFFVFAVITRSKLTICRERERERETV